MPALVSPVMEDYLKTIFKLGQTGDPVSTNDLARSLHVAPASVTQMVKKLSRLRLVRHRSYQGVELLPAGRKMALETLRHHRLLELYLTEALGYSWDRVHEEAEKLEHHISEDFEEKICELLGDPQVDPHGHPIPTKDGRMPALVGEPLAAANVGDTLVVKRVDDEDPEFLRYLSKLGLLPETRIEILEREPFSGPLTLRVGKQKQIIGQEVAERVFASAVLRTSDTTIK